MVRSWVELSLYVPVAVNDCVVPWATNGIVGVTANETRVAAVTVNVVPPAIAPMVADSVARPGASAAARPAMFAAPDTVATAVFEDDQTTCPVTSWVVPSL